MKKDTLSYLKNKNLTWFFLNTGVNTGDFNMACDEYLLKELIRGNFQLPVLRFYGWVEPTISLGVNQQLKNNIKLKHYFPFTNTVVKRMTGGQAVLHGMNSEELTYSIVVHYLQSAKQFYCETGNVFLHFLKNYDLNGSFGFGTGDYTCDFNCFNSKTPADIVVDGVKVIGSAQRRKKQYILQHGSIRLDLIRKLSQKEISFNEAADNLKTSFNSKLQVDFINYALNDSDCEKIKSSYKEILVSRRNKLDANTIC